MKRALCFPEQLAGQPMKQEVVADGADAALGARVVKPLLSSATRDSATTMSAIQVCSCWFDNS